MSTGDEDGCPEKAWEGPLEERTLPISRPVEEDPTVISPAEQDPTVVSGVGETDGDTAADLSGPEDAAAPSAALSPLLLERVEPSLGRGERLRWDAAHGHVRVGRAEHNDLRLYTASASRNHAVISGNEAGAWTLTPAEGKSVSIDGDPTDEPIELEVGMNLVFGGDHLRCVAEGPGREEAMAGSAAERRSDAGPGSAAERRSDAGPAGSGGRVSWMLIGGIAATGLGLIVYAWLTG